MGLELREQRRQILEHVVQPPHGLVVEEFILPRCFHDLIRPRLVAFEPLLTPCFELNLFQQHDHRIGRRVHVSIFVREDRVCDFPELVRYQFRHLDPIIRYEWLSSDCDVRFSSHSGVTMSGVVFEIIS